jgi:signal peptidase I
MHTAAPVPDPRPTGRPHFPSFRQFLQAVILLVVFLLVFRTVGAEPFHVPTGSMWPALAGNHRATDCPRCGYRVLVGQPRTERGSAADRDRFYRAAVCPNCGCTELGLDRVPECPGDHLLVNKSVFDLRRPRRWEMVVFRCPADPAKAFVKRIVGLPGETLQVRGGDVYIDGQLARKSLEEVRAVRIPVFDNNYQPGPDGFRDRWESQPAIDAGQPVAGTSLRLDAEDHPDRYRCLVYRNYSLDEHQCRALRDEYAYNGGDPGAQATVHDFMLECDLQVARGSGWVLFGISDGQDRLIAELPVGRSGAEPDGGALLREGRTPFSGEPPEDAGEARVYARAPGFRLEAGTTYHIELAFVDRRLTLAVDGRCPFAPVDLPTADRRAEVVRPVKVGARGVRAVVRNFRLFRDIHYTPAGDNGVAGVVSLGPAEYFVLGDNSPNSDDSRFWPNRGVVPLANFIGKPFLAHLPSRVVTWNGLGGPAEHIAPDWGRIRWLH